MSVNRHQPHVFVLPEDDANRQMANGFTLHWSLIPRRMQVLEEAGGWLQVLERFKTDQVVGMSQFADRFVILLIDFDGREDRIQAVRAEIPEPLRNRVFVLGTLTQPEELRQALGTYETIGLAMAKDCQEGTNATWSHRLLSHNAVELDRLRSQVSPFLFRETPL